MAAKIAAKIVFLPAMIQTFSQIDAYFKNISFISDVNNKPMYVSYWFDE